MTHRPIETTEEVIQLKEEIKLLKAQDYSGRYRKLIGSLLGEGNIPLEIEMLIKQTASTKEKLQYATAIQNLNNYMEAAKTDVNFSKFQSADAFVEYLQKRHIYVVPDFVFGFLDPAMRAFRATMDISFGGAQGAFASVTNPKITLKNFTKALAGGLRQSKKSFTGKAKDNTELDAVMIDFFSRDRFIDGTYDKAGFDITKTKYDTYGKLDMQDIPVVGQFTSRVFKPFDVAFEIFMARQKLDIFDALIADTKGDLSKEELQDYNRIASSIAMRVSPKQLGGAAEVASAVLWSASLMVSSWNLLTAHSLGLGLKTPQARRVAYRKSLMAMGFYVGIITTLAQATDEDDDWYVVGDPTSSDFGKLIIGDRRITLLPILSGYIVLFSRMISGRYTNTKGKTISLGGIYDTGIHDAIFENSELPLGKYGGTQNVGQVAGRFVQYKFSPLVTAGLTTLGIKTGFEDDPEDFSYEARLLRSVSPLSTVAVYDNFQSEESQSLQTYMSILEVLGKYNTEYK